MADTDPRGSKSSVCPVVVSVLNQDDPPVLLTTDVSVVENSPPGTVVAFLVTADDDVGDVVTLAVANSTLFSIQVRC